MVIRAGTGGAEVTFTDNQALSFKGQKSYILKPIRKGNDMGKRISLVTGVMVLLFLITVGGAFAMGEVDSIHLDLDRYTVTARQETVIRACALFLTQNYELADKINGFDIDGATFSVKSLSYPADIEIYEVTTMDPLGGPVRGSGDALSIGSVGSKEFAVKYRSSLDELDSDTLEVTLEKGTRKVTAQVTVQIEEPEANCYVVRTGGVARPDVLAEIPAQNNDNGAVKKAGQGVTVSVFAAYLQGSTGRLYYTTRLPAGANNCTLYGEVTTGTNVFATVNDVTLVDGYADVQVTVEDLKIPEYVMFKERLLPSVGFGFGGFRESVQQRLKPVFQTGITITYKAESSITRHIGSQSGDVNNDGEITFSKSEVFPKEHASLISTERDTTHFRPAALDTVRLTGLPLNQIINGSTGAMSNDLYGGILATDRTLAEYRQYVSPLDAWFLADVGPDTQPASFVADADSLFGAIIGYDAYDNPAPFSPSASAGQGFVLGFGSPGMENSIANMYGYVIGSSVTQDQDYQAFIPFQINKPAHVSSITQVYIAGDTYGSIGDTYDDIDSASEGMSFAFGDYFSYITTTGFWDNNCVNTKMTFEAAVAGDNNIVMQAVDTLTGKNMKIGLEDAADPGTEFILTSGTEHEIAAFSAVAGGFNNNTILLLFEDAVTGSKVSFPKHLTSGIYPAHPLEYPASLILPEIEKASVTIDKEENHGTINVEPYRMTSSISISAPFRIFDGLGNEYAPFYYNLLGNIAPQASLEDAGVAASVVLPDASGAPSDTAFPEAFALVDVNTVTVSFDPDQITAGQDVAFLKVTAGTAAGFMRMDLKSTKGIKTHLPFVPFPNVDDTPLYVMMADQNGDTVVPVTQIYSIGNNPGIEILYDYDTGNAKIIDSDPWPLDGTLSISSESYGAKAILAITPESGTIEVGIDLRSTKYADKGLIVSYNPDFEPPIVGVLTPVFCGFEIKITDNKAVNGAATEVIVINSQGDLVNDLSIQAADSGASSTVTVTSPDLVPGTYSVTVVAVDGAGNRSDSLTRTVTIHECNIPGPLCSSIVPTYGIAGDNNTDITITSGNVSFVDGVTDFTFSCSDIIVNAVNILSASEAVVNISISPGAAEQTCDVTVINGSETLTCEGVFAIFLQHACVNDNSGALDVQPVYGNTGDIVTHTVRIQDAPTDVQAFGFDVLYDPAVLQYDSYTADERFDDYFVSECSEVEPGVVRCGGFDDTETIFAGEDVEMFTISFQVLADPCVTGAGSELQLGNLKDDLAGWSTSQGCFECRCGCDISGDGDCTPQDGLMRLLKYLGVGDEGLCYDITGDGNITPADALCSFKVYLDRDDHCLIY